MISKSITSGIVSGISRSIGFSNGLPIDAEAAAYQIITGISSVRARAISDFLVGLDALGLRSSFVDGACWRADSHLTTGSVAHSLRGGMNITLSGSPERARTGIQFDGVNDWGIGAIAALNGAKTVFVPSSGDLDDTVSTYERYFDLRKSGVASSFRLALSNGNGIFGEYNAATVTSAAINFGSIRQRGKWHCLVASDAGTAAAASAISSFFPGPTKQTATGIVQPEFTSLVIGGSANTGLSAAIAYCRRLMPGFLVFSAALTDQQKADVLALCDLTLWPQTRIVFEGDSITNDIQSRYSDKGIFKGANIDHVDRWAGGETSNHGVTQLGTASGLSDSLAATDRPVIAWIGFGANDLGNGTDWWWTRMQTLCAYARARGMIVAVPTVTKGSGYATGTSNNTNRLAANAILRADAGATFDSLVDVDATFVDLAGADYYLDAAYFRDGVHYTLTAGGGADVAAGVFSAAISSHIL